MNEVFTASRITDLLTPDEVVFNEKGVTFRTRKIMGGSESFVFYTDISGVEIDNGVFFSVIRVIPRARVEIVIEGFSKSDAQRIKELILERV